MQGGGHRRFVAAGLEGDARPRSQHGQPVGLGGVRDVVELRHQVVSRAARFKIQFAPRGEVGGAGVEPERQGADPSDDKVVLLRACEPHRDVGFPLRQAEFPRVGDQLDQQVGVRPVQGRQGGRQDVTGDDFGAGDADGPRQPRVTAPDLAFERQRLGFEAFGLGEHFRTGQGGDVAVWGPVEQAHAEAGFEGGEATSHGGLRDAKLPRRGRQAPVSRDGQEETQVVPVEHRGRL